MRAPAVDALLVDHPAIPVPAPCPERGWCLPTRPRLLGWGGGRRPRLALAAQLLAVTAHLAELDLWPGRGGLRRAVVADEGGPPRAVLGNVPVPLAPLLRRLGGGERALRRVRDGCIDTVAALTGLPVSLAGDLKRIPSPFVEPCLERVLEELADPLDPATARSLWCVRWRLPALPESREAAYWGLADDELAQRLGAAVWAARWHDGGSVWWLRQVRDDEVTGPLPATASRGLLVLSGQLSEDDLECVARWVGRPGCSAVSVGSFPAGWNPPAPEVVEADRLELHLRLVGVPAERARREVERRLQSCDPMVVEDRAALTAAAATRFRDGGSAPAAGSGAAARVRRVLELLPEGLPEGFVVLHSGSRPEALRRQHAAGLVVQRSGRWAVPGPVRLRRDPLHREVAALLDAEDPRRLLHAALGGEGPDRLLAWARDRVEKLDGAAVRAVLAPVEPDDLDPRLGSLLVEACLTELDLTGMRSALPACTQASRRIWQRCIEVVDAGETSVVLPSLAEVEECPRAAAEVALRALQVARRRARGAAADADRVLGACLDRLRGAARAVVEMRRTLLNEPECLARREWRRRVVGGHAELRREWRRCRAVDLLWQGRAGPAERLFRGLLDTSAPGRLGLLHLDLGAAALLSGRGEEAEHENLRALRLLEAAGFQRRLGHVRFNLGVGDLDHLRVAAARERLCAGAEDGDPELELELARLALAIGGEEELRRRVAELEVHAVDAGFGASEALLLLRGVLRLLDGDAAGAAGLLAKGGEEGESWRAVADAVARGDGPGGDDDGWGVGRCARLVSRHRRGERGLPPDAAPADDLRDAFAVALGERLLGRQPWLSGAQRRRVARLLERHGLTGWAASLADDDALADGALRGMATLLDGVGFDGLQEEHATALLGALGVSGLEVALAGGTTVRIGRGRPGPPVRHRELTITPLGGEVAASGLWQLMAGVLWQVTPAGSGGDLDPEAAATGIYGSSAATAELRRELRALAPSSIPVMLLGETGVGKDVAARALHQLSGRSGQFVPVNVAAIPATLLESDLFGVVKGAFTGADRGRRGLVESAHGGTLFLDEIGDLDPTLQVKLLRFLESMEIRPVGATSPHHVDVRVVSATHRDLRAAVEAGSFRHDLYYRVASAEVRIRPLRERLDDIPVLTRLFVEQAVAHDGLARARWLPAVDEQLRAHSWPGNVRELKHVVQVAMVRAAGEVVLPEHLPIAAAPRPVELPRGGYEEALLDFRRRLLGEALARHGGNRSAAARELGISRQTLLYHIKALGLR